MNRDRQEKHPVTGAFLSVFFIELQEEKVCMM